MSAAVLLLVLAAAPEVPAEGTSGLDRLKLALYIATGVAGLGLLALIVARREPWHLDEAPERHRVLRRAYERALRTLKDLEFDVQVGTLSAEEHGRLKAEYKVKAIVLRRELERSKMAALRSIAQGRAPGKAQGLSRAEAETLEELVARARAGLEKEGSGR